MFIFYECNVCGHERTKPLKFCPACQIGDMVAMTVIRKDVLDKLKLELLFYKQEYGQTNDCNTNNNILLGREDKE